jgi:uncharacterized protein (TIGR03435 family)
MATTFVNCLLRSIIIVLLTLVFVGIMPTDCAHAQVVPEKVPTAYDVISIRPHKPRDGNMSMGYNYCNFQAVNVSLLSLLENAYNIRQGLIFGLPKWAEDARWDIRAKLPNVPEDVLKDLSEEQCSTLLVSMLADRFHVRTHEENRILPVYDLVIAKNGPKFTQNAAENADEIKGIEKSGTSYGSTDKYQYIYCHDSNLAFAISTLASFLDHDVVDKTGLIGNYSFALRYSGQEVAATSSGDTANLYPSIFTALQDQIGLKLVPSKGPVNTLVIDHAEPPTPN